MSLLCWWNRVASLPFEARWVLGSDGERRSHCHSGSWGPASSDPARTPRTGKEFQRHRAQQVFTVLFSSWRLRREAFSEGFLWCSLEMWATVYGSAAFSEMSKSPQLTVQLKDYVRVAKATGKTLSVFLLKSVGKPQGKQCQASAEKEPVITSCILLNSKS